jgi:hypothetical protein
MDEKAWTWQKEGVEGVFTWLNEFMHRILCNIAGFKWGLKKYDRFLEKLLILARSVDGSKIVMAKL